jgi:uncharacterized membrane protein
VASADLAVVAEALAAAVPVEGGRQRMRSKEFISNLDHDRIVAAIRAAESKTSGQIRIYIQRGHLKENPLAAAQKTFADLKMEQTKDRNAVLIWMAPRARKLAVIGDEGIHQKCGDSLWQSVVLKMTDHFKKERFTDAIVDAIGELGAVLSAHFPHQAGGQNELPDAVIES